MSSPSSPAFSLDPAANDMLAATNARDIAIDSLRGLSILAVLLYHYVGYEGAGGAYWPPASYGNYGVMLFFMISGYCIMLSADSSRSPWHFWSKRLGRLMPALLICGALTTVLKQVLPVASDRYVTWGDFGATLLALPTLNLAGIDYRPPDGAYWSLIAEFQFYALVVLLMLLGARRYMLEALLALEALVLAVASVQQLNLSMVFVYLPAFIVRVAFKRLVDTAGNSRRSGWIGLAGSLLAMLIGAALSVSDPSMPVGFSYVVAFFFCTGLFGLALHRQFGASSGVFAGSVRGASLLGVVSYPLYLLHQDIGQMLHELLAKDAGLSYDYFLRLFLIPGAMIVLAALVYHFVERPFIRPLTRLLGWAPAPFLALLGLGRVRALLSLSLIFVLVVTALRTQAGSAVDLAMQTAKGISAQQINSNQDKPWGGFQVERGTEETVVDFRSVPAHACPELMRRLQCLPGVKRLALGTRGNDEMPVPVNFFVIELRCAGILSHTVRLIMHAKPVESSACL